MLARHPALTAPDREECNQLFADLMKVQPLILNVVVRARDGTLQCSGLPGRGVGQRTPIPSVENKVLSSGQPVVSDLTIDAEAQKPTVIMAYPVRGAGGAVVGVLDFGIDLSRVQTLFARIPLPEGSVITLTDRQGLILARSHDAERFIGTTMAARGRRWPAADRAGAGSGWGRAAPGHDDGRSRGMGRDRRHSETRGLGPVLAVVSPKHRHHLDRGVGLVVVVLVDRPAPVGSAQRTSRGRAAHRRRRSVAASARRRHAEPRGRRAAGGVRHDGRKPSPDARRARSAGRAGAQDARDGRVVAAAGGEAGAAGGGGGAGVRRGARAQQPAPGDPGRGRAARAPSRSVPRRAPGNRVHQGAEHAARARSFAACRASAASRRDRRRRSICATSSPRSCSFDAPTRTTPGSHWKFRSSRPGRCSRTSPSSSRSS